MVDYIEKNNPKTTFKFTFQAYDPIHGCSLDRGNHIYNNNQSGLYLSMVATNNSITYNVIYNNTIHGIYFMSTCLVNNLTGNKIYNNDESGIYFEDGCDFNIITRNKVYKNGIHGISLSQNCQNNTFYRNEIYQNNNSSIEYTSYKTVSGIKQPFRIIAKKGKNMLEIEYHTMKLQ